MGMDWLIQHSPMHVDWKHKWVHIPYENSITGIYGRLDTLPEVSVIQVSSIVQTDSISHPPPLSPVVSALLTEFQSVFAPPSGYPPARFCDHTIPLVVGAGPIQVRPYQYPPAVKDEIERQVVEMLS